MRLLLDTHVLLWWIADDEQLDSQTRDIILAADDVLVSTASVWEIAIKIGTGRLRLPDEWRQHVHAGNFTVLPIHLGHALRVADLPHLHRDPFDRMLVAQAQIENCTVLTADAKIAQYDVRSVLLR